MFHILNNSCTHVFLLCVFKKLFILYCGTLLVAQTVKRLSTMWETWVRSLGWEDPLEKEMGAERVKLWPGAEWALYGDTGPGTLGRAPGCVER